MSGVRVTAGSLKGRRIDLPSSPVRPTSSRAREAVFNILATEIGGSRFLDLFAGSGIMSLEAISRGAIEALAVEISGRSVAALEDLARRLSIPLRARRGDALRFLTSAGSEPPFDVVYADPPYDFGSYPNLLRALDQTSLVSPGSIVAVEHRRKTSLDAGTELARLVHREGRSWGQVTVEFFDVRETGTA